MFNIGSIVCLKSNPDFKMTVCKSGNQHDKTVECVYVNKSQKIEKSRFHTDCLIIYEDAIEDVQLEKIPFYYCKSKDCYSFFEYASIYGSSVHASTEESESKNDSTRFVFDFKKYHKHKQHIHNLVSMALDYLECEQIVCIPGHTKELNSLQKTFGITIERTSESEPRKYNHKKELCKGYESSYSIDYTKLSNKILLVDDIITSGATMHHFKEILTSKGFDVTCLSIGINHNLDFETAYNFYLFK